MKWLQLILFLTCCFAFTSVSAQINRKDGLYVGIYGKDGKPITKESGRYKFAYSLHLTPGDGLPKIDSIVSGEVFLSYYWQYYVPRGMFSNTEVAPYPFSVIVVDSLMDDTMIVSTSSDIDSIQFTPGHFRVSPAFSQLFKLSTDAGSTIINQNIRLFNKDSTSLLKYPSSKTVISGQGYYLKDIGAGAVVAYNPTQSYLFISQDGEAWDSLNYGSKVPYIINVCTINDDYFYTTKGNSKWDLNHILLYKRGEITPTKIPFPENVTTEYATFKTINLGYAIGYTDKETKDYNLYKTVNQGKTWTLIVANLRHYSFAFDKAEQFYIKNRNGVVANNETREILYISEDKDLNLSGGGQVVNPFKDKGINPLTDRYIDGRSMVVFTRDDKCYFGEYAYKNLSGKMIAFKGNTGVVASTEYFLITRDQGKTWTYYPFINKSIYVQNSVLLSEDKLIVTDNEGVVSLIRLNDL